MKKVFLLGLALSFIASAAFAQTQAAPETITLKGDIIDNVCAGAQKAENLAEFVKTHAKQCAISPACETAGYSIFADGMLTKFDKESNLKVAEFLKKEESKLQVEVVAKKVGDELSIVSIGNQQ